MMELGERCVECLLSRVALECRLSGAGSTRSDDIVKSARNILESMKGSTIPHPQIASIVHRHAYALLGTSDPFADLKIEGNRLAIEACRQVRHRLTSFRDMVLASIIGNTFDYGVRHHTVDENFSRFFEDEFRKGLTIDETDAIHGLCSRVVYLTDNCGEIVFDRLLLEYLHTLGAHLTLVVRDAPILNDATLAEVEALGLSRFVDVVTTTGCGSELGIRLDRMTPEFAEAMKRCTIVIAKGMANYESLSICTNLPPVAYLMAVKCDPVAEDVGVPRGSRVAMLCR